MSKDIVYNLSESQRFVKLHSLFYEITWCKKHVMKKCCNRSY